MEEAAIGGHPNARYSLGCVEESRGRMDRAVQHWINSAKLGHDGSLNALQKLYKAGAGNVNKDDFAAALRGHQAAIDATKSPQRDAAEEFQRKSVQTGTEICISSYICFIWIYSKMQRAEEFLRNTY